MIQTDFIISRAKENLPANLRRAPWRILGHGTGLLSKPEELNAYLAAYGEMHKVKCIAAVQNFPYEKLPQRIHIVDWGCGQGLGSLCFLDCLYDRGLLNRVKAVTLIEPSAAALGKAGEFLRNALTNFDVRVDTVPLYLPADKDNPSTLSSLQMNLPGTVHVFANILDIPSVNLRKTAQIIEEGQGMQFVLCSSPVNDNAARLDEFAEYFTGTNLFSDICDQSYGYTSDTYHRFGCKTKCFYFNSTDSTLNTEVREGHYSESGAYDDYDMEAMVRSGYLSKVLFKAYSSISSRLASNDRIFLKPDLNGDTPDIIVVRPGKGILVLNIFDEDLNRCSSDSVTFCVNGLPTASPLARAYGYKNSILEQHSTEILNATFTDRSAWFIVKPAVWFSQGTRLQIESVFANQLNGKGNTSRNVISGVLTLAADEISASDLWRRLDIQYSNRSFTEKACNQFVSLLSSQWHCFNEGDNEIHLTQRQLELSKSYEGRIKRIKGIAGSGKTQILASTAVNCQLRTGRRVLILTYNITLVNYIRYRIGRIPADFPWNKFTITNYHNFFTSQAKNNGLKLTLASYDDPLFFQNVCDNLPKYSAILIDEAQDYKTEWFRIIFENFLEEKGEVVVFGDEKQDVYRRNSFNTIPSVRGHTWGHWTELNEAYRINNQKIFDITQAFQLEFLKDAEGFDGTRELTFEGGTEYHNIPNYSGSQLASLILEYISREGLASKNVVVLSQTRDILRLIDYSFGNDNGESCMTTFETKEEFDSLLESPQAIINSDIQKELERIRAFKKAHFTMDTDSIKVSTIYSFKGWDASCVVLLILPEPGQYDAIENRPELIYTAITRAKDYLLVINLGNSTYHQFFQNQINNGIL